MQSPNGLAAAVGVLSIQQQLNLVEIDIFDHKIGFFTQKYI
jgi:hypothetical protein